MENKVIASLPMTNVASLNVYDIEYGIDDYVKVGLNNQKPSMRKLYSNTKDNYFNWAGGRYYLNEFVRVN